MTASSEPTDCVIAGDGTTETTTNIDAGAPVISRQEIDIAAPLQVVLDLHTDVAAWPSWNPDISNVVLERPLAAGSSFRWSSGGLDIRSTVYALTERARILWGGTVQGIVGIHQWIFIETASGTHVATRESFNGEPVEANPAALQDALDASLVSWLGYLKSSAEANT